MGSEEVVEIELEQVIPFRDRAPLSVGESRHLSKIGDMTPSGGDVGRYYEGKYRVFLRMHGDQLAYRALMST